MQKYDFRLERVRRVRRVQEDVAKAALLAANAEVQRTAAVVADRHAAYENAAVVSQARVGVSFLNRDRHFAELALQSLIAARTAHDVAKSIAAERALALTDAAQKVRALDRLDERAREDYRIEAGRDDDRTIDDIVTARTATAGGSR